MVLLRRFLYEITQPFPSKIRRLAAMQGKGGRETWSVCRFVFFLQRRGGHPFLIGLCPKGSLIIKNEKLKNKKVRGHAAEDQNQIRASRESRTIVRNQYMPLQIVHCIRRFPTAIIHGGYNFKATKRSEKVVKVRLIKSFLCSEQFEVDIYSICGFGFSRENGRFNRVGQVSSLIPWRKLDGYQIF